MARYDYYCELNGRVVEVEHPMSMKLQTWKEVCEYAGLNPNDTFPDASVIRLISAVTPMVFRLKGIDKDEPSDRLIP
jgi:hypothetical protein